MSKTIWRYGLWTATLLTLWWITALVSALVGGKGLDKMRVPVDGTVEGRPEWAVRVSRVRQGKTRDPYDYDGPERRGDGCAGRPVVLDGGQS
jgi:hypothetical protein